MFGRLTLSPAAKPPAALVLVLLLRHAGLASRLYSRTQPCTVVPPKDADTQSAEPSQPPPPPPPPRRRARPLPVPSSPNHRRAEAERAKSEASRVLREKEALRERVAALQAAADRSSEAAEAVARERDEATVAAATAAQRAQQERDGLAEMEGENEGLRTRLQMAEEELGGLAAAADQVKQ